MPPIYGWIAPALIGFFEKSESDDVPPICGWITLCRCVQRHEIWKLNNFLYNCNTFLIDFSPVDGIIESVSLSTTEAK